MKRKIKSEILRFAQDDRPLALLRLGHIRVSTAENEQGMFTMLEVKEE